LATSHVSTKENTIDLKLRNTIRDSRLLICDLTDRNNGAYFEAGFAEGLGKAVIYICEQSSFDEREQGENRLHFDVEHQEIYRWKKDDDDSIKEFKGHLEAKIRVSL
jgi:nucleoside 2-deoxyribosyltransferase